MMKKQQGFTLIELVAVIVILGALAVVALPRFIDLSDEAEQAAAEGVAGSLSAGFALNYAAELADEGSSVNVNSDLTGDPDPSVDPWASILQDPDILSEYTVNNSDNCDFSTTPDVGESVTCELELRSGSLKNPPTFTAIAVSS